LSGLYLTGIISREEFDAGKVVGLERLIAKKSGLEFSSLLHQFGCEVVRSLHGATVKKVLQAVNPAAAKDRLPKRGEPLPPPNPPAPAPGKEGRRAIEAAQTAAEVHRPAGPQAAARPAGKTPLPPPGAGPKRSADGSTKPGGKTGPKPFVVKPNMGKAPPAEESAKPPAKQAGGGKPATPPRPESAKQGKKPEAIRRPAAKPAAPVRQKLDGGQKAKPPAKAGKRHSAQLAKRKPR
jgi:hypothetical protein